MEAYFDAFPCPERELAVMFRNLRIGLGTICMKMSVPFREHSSHRHRISRRCFHITQQLHDPQAGAMNDWPKPAPKKIEPLL